MPRANGEGDDAWSTIEPEGLAMALLTSSAIFAGLTTIVMAMRVYIRVVKRSLGTDDWMMVGGYATTLGQAIVTIYGVTWGLGTRDHLLLPINQQKSKTALVVWQFLYAFSLCLIKGSICVTLMRITKERKYLLILKSLIVVCFTLSGIGAIVVLSQCRPLPAYWDKRVDGVCIPGIYLTLLSVAASVINVLTDFAVALIPFFLLRDVQLRPRLKVYVRAILAVGLLAGVASVVRCPFTSAYSNPVDLVYNTGSIVLCTIIECGIGIIAGSLPMLRAFFKELTKDCISNRATRGSGALNTGGNNLVTIGKIKSRHSPIYDTELQITIVGIDEYARSMNGDAVNDPEKQRSIRSSRHGFHSGSRDDLGSETDSTCPIIKVTKDVHQSPSSGLNLESSNPSPGRNDE